MNAPSESQATEISFAQLGLCTPLQNALTHLGYQQPSPIQAQSIPVAMQGKDILATAQTGTGKTAAFALPLLHNIKVDKLNTQVLVLTPTRELTIQVASAFSQYARELKGVHVLPIYGGGNMSTQLKQLKKGVQVVVGTPGRIMDHMRRSTLKLDSLSALVLDEADEMLRMGFIDDINWILEHKPQNSQTLLFSATMPAAIRKVAERFLNNAAEINVKAKTVTVERIRQRYWKAVGTHKLDALSRILEIEPSDGIIVFVRTKTLTVELAEQLNQRGYLSAAINGDMSQPIRERTIHQLKTGKINILIATDVAARGIDVPRISHVINYDVPFDPEAYVHRIGRTGRAGRHGDAILFVAPREQRMLRMIEKVTRQTIEPMTLPTPAEAHGYRMQQFKQQIVSNKLEDIADYQQWADDFCHEFELNHEQLMASLLKTLQHKKAPIMPSLKAPKVTVQAVSAGFNDSDGDRDRDRNSQRSRKKDARKGKPEGRPSPSVSPIVDKQGEKIDMARYQVDVGREHKTRPGDLVGAIANETGISSEYIGHIKLYDHHSTVDLPSDMPKDIMQILRKVRVSGRPLNIKLESADNTATNAPKPRKRKIASQEKSYQEKPKANSSRKEKSNKKDKDTRRKSTKKPTSNK